MGTGTARDRQVPEVGRQQGEGEEQGRPREARRGREVEQRLELRLAFLVNFPPVSSCTHATTRSNMMNLKNTFSILLLLLLILSS